MSFYVTSIVPVRIAEMMPTTPVFLLLDLHHVRDGVGEADLVMMMLLPPPWAGRTYQRRLSAPGRNARQIRIGLRRLDPDWAHSMELTRHTLSSVISGVHCDRRALDADGRQPV